MTLIIILLLHWKENGLGNKLLTVSGMVIKNNEETAILLEKYSQ